MESLIAAQRKWERQNGLEKTIEDVQAVIDLLTKARDDVASETTEPAIALAKLKSPLKDSFERLNKDAKELHTSITNYGKLLDKRFKPMKVPQSSLSAFATHAPLTNRAIGMHLLREGMFDVASTFVGEALEGDGEDVQDTRKFWQIGERTAMDVDGDWQYGSDDEDMEHEKEHDAEGLQSKFADMYSILHALRNEHSLDPAIAWTKANSEALEARGSNLEFDLCRLRFIELYTADHSRPGEPHDFNTGPLQALQYAHATFPQFSHRYFKEIASLSGSVLYAQGLPTSPYRTLPDPSRWEDVANAFVREFCGLLGLSERSPLYTAVTAGGIALPVLEKLERVMGEVGGQWTSANELPVEIPLPPSYLFHSIFVCPVSKEQATDSNPPMMMPCGHVIAKESLEKISRGSSLRRFKCPYCPNESHPRDAKKVYL